MRIAILGATGKVGSLVVEQALERGHEVIALTRKPDMYVMPVGGGVEVRQADVTDAAHFPRLSDADVIISALGLSKGDAPGVLIAGARVLASTGVRTLWLGALGAGTSAGAGGALYQLMMKMFVGKELAEKAQADAIALKGGATVFHAPDLWVGGVSENRVAVALENYRKPFFPPHAARATVAALMLDEAEAADRHARILVPLASK
ncbi:NAD(P)-dependent oxidoreductase [Subtercola lobariae]|uniref:NAD(P)-binding domain-containing protein n=1 Tax=Subtercola lobariae TaxID=1588641 RepID=A0A917B8Z6_9MICO|nr:NAD(P)H-binding protein [Subtercola lobariae]GGF30849.1 hypothetical protein GCM10011399_25150 [Subtercola lobariae]